MTTSTEVANMLLEHITTAPHSVITRVEVLEPQAALTELGAHAALVVHLKNGERFGMEVCPFPRLPQPSGSLRSMTLTAAPEPDPEDPSTIQAPTDEPPVPEEPPYTP